MYFCIWEAGSEPLSSCLHSPRHCPQIGDPEEAHMFLHPLGNVRERRAGAMPVSGTPFWTLGKVDVVELVGAVAVMGVSWSVWAAVRFQRRE